MIFHFYSCRIKFLRNLLTVCVILGMIKSRNKSKPYNIKNTKDKAYFDKNQQRLKSPKITKDKKETIYILYLAMIVIIRCNVKDNKQ